MRRPEDLSRRLDRQERRSWRVIKFSIAVYVILWLAFWITVGIVAIHFIGKWW